MVLDMTKHTFVTSCSMYLQLLDSHSVTGKASSRNAHGKQQLQPRQHVNAAAAIALTTGPSDRGQGAGLAARSSIAVFELRSMLSQLSGAAQAQ